jgi:hypothetical protein
MRKDGPEPLRTLDVPGIDDYSDRYEQRTDDRSDARGAEL